jgi:GDP-mannose 6-dehydrogenase
VNISVFGLGYVGAVTGACFAELGHTVVGVDVNRGKVDMFNAGQSPIIEHGLPERISRAVGDGRIRATDDTEDAIATTDVSLICVGTPSAPNGSLSLVAVDAVVKQIGQALRKKKGDHTVVVRSTVLPGTTEERIQPMLIEASGRAIDSGLEICFNPEFLREGTAVKDFYNPPFTVTGSIGEAGYAVVEAIYDGVSAQSFRTDCRLAESVKYLCNAYHALKITFANEVGRLLKHHGVDSRQAMEIFCEDRILNVSRAYLRPGFAFGGSCLPKDLRALLYIAKTADVALPMLSQLLASNDAHIDMAYRMIADGGRDKVAIFGLAFKPGTDDLRESPLVALAERLIGRGFEVGIFDSHVELARLTGANQEFIDKEIPHLERLLAATPDAVLADANTIVIGHARPEDVAAIRAVAAGRRIIDLQGVAELAALEGADYQGMCW